MAILYLQLKIDALHVLMNGSDADAQECGGLGIGLAMDNPKFLSHAGSSRTE